MPHLSFTQDLGTLLVGAVVWAFVFDRSGLVLSAFSSVLLSIACWIGCTAYAHLWNRRFHFTFKHHLLCFVAAVATFWSAFAFGILAHMDEAAKVSVEAWRAQLDLETAMQWKESVFQKVYAEIKKLGLEDLTDIKPPAVGGDLIPLSNQQSREAMAYIWANEALQNFRDHRPFLSRVISGTVEVPKDAIVEDVRVFFNTPTNAVYPSSRAINLAASTVKDQLEKQTPRVVRVSRLVLTLLFLLVEAIPYSIVGIAAYNDLKMFTSTEQVQLG